MPPKGQKHTNEARRAIGESKLGKNNPMYGKTHSPQTRAKIGETHRGVAMPEKEKSARSAIQSSKRRVRSQQELDELLAKTQEKIPALLEKERNCYGDIKTMTVLLQEFRNLINKIPTLDTIKDKTTLAEFRICRNELKLPRSRLANRVSRATKPAQN